MDEPPLNQPADAWQAQPTAPTSLSPFGPTPPRPPESAPWPRRRGFFRLVTVGILVVSFLLQLYSLGKFARPFRESILLSALILIIGKGWLIQGLFGQRAWVRALSAGAAGGIAIGNTLIFMQFALEVYVYPNWFAGIQASWAIGGILLLALAMAGAGVIAGLLFQMDRRRGLAAAAASASEPSGAWEATTTMPTLAENREPHQRSLLGLRLLAVLGQTGLSTLMLFQMTMALLHQMGPTVIFAWLTQSVMLIFVFGGVFSRRVTWRFMAIGLALAGALSGLSLLTQMLVRVWTVGTGWTAVTSLTEGYLRYGLLALAAALSLYGAVRLAQIEWQSLMTPAEPTKSRDEGELALTENWDQAKPT